MDREWPCHWVTITLSLGKRGQIGRKLIQTDNNSDWSKMSVAVQKPDFSQLSPWRTNKGRQSAIDRIKELTGEEVSINEITDATWPKKPEMLNYGHSGRGRAVTYSDRELVEWRWRVNQGWK